MLIHPQQSGGYVVIKFILFLFGLILTFCVLAQNQNDALRARDQALNALKGFNPSTVLKGYTARQAAVSELNPIL